MKSNFRWHDFMNRNTSPRTRMSRSVPNFCIHRRMKLAWSRSASTLTTCRQPREMSSSEMLPVWNHLHVRSFTGTYRKLYAYFHNKQLDIFSFDKNRFKFTNSFEASHAKDAIYFMLYVWKQMGLDTHKDELHLVGEMPAKDDMLADLRRYLQKVYIINPSAEFNRAPITQIKGLPFDLLSLYVKRN